MDRRAGAGGLRPPRAQLVRYGPGGETLEKVEQVRPVNERVQALIGLDSDAFLRTVILPQGRFARLLVEDAPSARTEILRQVWRTHDLEAAGDRARQRLAEVRTLAARLQDEVERHPPDPETHLAELTAKADAADRRAVALADLRDRSARAADTLRQSEATIAAACRADERVTPSAMDALTDRLVPVESAQRRMETEATELEGRKAGLKRDLNGIPTDDGPDDREIARTLAALDGLPDEVAKAVGAAGALRAAITGEAEAAKQDVKAQQNLESANDRLARHQAMEPPLAAAVVSARESAMKAERWYERCADLRERIRSTEDGLGGREKEMVVVTARLATARDALQGARERLQRAERELTETGRANAAAVAAHGLCPGDECPVCRGDLPEGWVPPRDTGLDAARETSKAARSEADEASRVVADLEAQRKSARQEITSVKRDLDALRSESAGALDHLRGAAGPDDAFPLAQDAPLPGRDEVLDPARQRLREAEAKHGDHCTETEELRKAQTSARVEATSARQTLTHTRNDIDRTRNTAGETLDALNRNIRSIPLSFRPQLALPPDPVELHTVDTTPVDRASYAAREREKILQSRRRERDRLRTEIEETRTALKRLGETRKAQVEKPLQDLVRVLANHRTTLADAIRELATGTAIPAAIHYPVDAKTLREEIGLLRETMADVVELAADRHRSAVNAAEGARTEARMVAGQLDPPADPANLEALVQSTGKAATDAGYTARSATEARDAFAAILDDLLKLRKTAAEAAALELALGDLDAALKPGAFLKWLTLRRSRDLLVYASRMLKQMTAGRYSFADPGTWRTSSGWSSTTTPARRAPRPVSRAESSSSGRWRSRSEWWR